MNFIWRNQNFNNLYKLVRLYSRKSHYEVLKLRRNCTDKEIRNAFIRMSKEFHPDKNKDTKAQEKFVQVMEAYNVLGKPNSRAQYDRMTEVEGYVRTTPSNMHVYRTYTSYYNVKQPPNYGFYQESNNTEANEEHTSKEESYYGLQGINKVPNYIIIAMCFGVALIGLILQMFVIRESFLLHRKQLYEKSKLLGEELEQVRAVARENGNEVQTQLLLKKIVNAANPNVATATLGQALATDNKMRLGFLLTEIKMSDDRSDWSQYPQFSDDVRLSYETIGKLASFLTKTL